MGKKPHMGVQTGFIGLGNIGLPMARRLVAAGQRPWVYDVAVDRAGELGAEGAQVAASAGAVAAHATLVGVCVRDDADVRDVLDRQHGILATARRGSVVAIHSTVERATILDVARVAAEHGVDVIDACVAGGAVGAAAGTLTVMVGGPVDAVERARPLLQPFAGAIIHTGELGSGCVAKICHQMMQYVAWLAAREAMVLGQAAGLSPETIEAVTSASGVLAESTRRFLGLYKRPDSVRLSPAFQELLRNFVVIAEKDLNAAVALGDEVGIALPTIRSALPQMAWMYDQAKPETKA